MAKYKFDSSYMRHSGRTIARINGEKVYDGKGRLAGRFKDERIFDGKGRPAGRFDGKYVFDSRGRRVADRRQVEKDIDGNGGTSLVALWLLFVR